MKKILILIIISLILGVFITWITSLTYSKSYPIVCRVYYGYPEGVRYETISSSYWSCSNNITDEVPNADIISWVLDTLFWGGIVFVILLVIAKLTLKERVLKKIVKL